MDNLIALLNKLIPDKLKTREIGIYASLIVIFALILVGFTWGYVNPAISKSQTQTQSEIDSLKNETKLKESILIEKLDNINENIKDLKDDNKEIKGDIKGLLRRR